MNNQEFAGKSELLKLSVEKAQEKGEKVSITKRQASKFRNKKGIAYRYSKSLPKKKGDLDEKTI